MKLKLNRYPLVKMPEETQVALLLIKEELKSRKIFHVFHDIGIDDCYFQPHLDTLIMDVMGLDDGTDETFALYDEIMEKRSYKIDASNDSIMKQALKVYHELIEVKRTLQRKTK